MFSPTSHGKHPNNDESPDFAGLSSAPRETRTPTDHTVHKALNLARLPIPPQARSAGIIGGTILPIESIRAFRYGHERVFDPGRERSFR